MGKWTPYSGAAVITSTTAAWQDCDVSGIVGTNTAVLVLKNASANALIVKPKGGVEDLNLLTSGAGNGSRGCHCQKSSAGAGYLLVKTDTSGVFQYADGDLVGWTADVFLEGYFLPDEGVTTTVVSADTVTTSWADATVHADYRPPTGNYAISQTLFRADSLPDIAVSTRPDGETGNNWKTVFGLHHIGAAGARFYYNTGAASFGTVTPVSEVGSDGVYERIASASASSYARDHYWSEWSNYSRNRHTILSSAAVNAYFTAWDTVDLSSYIGEQEALVVLHISITSLSGTYIAVRKYGESLDCFGTAGNLFGPGIQQIGGGIGQGGIVLCPTDSLGRIQVAALHSGRTINMDLLGFIHSYDALSPSIDTGTISPSGSVVSLLSPEKLRFRLDDPSGSGIDSSTFNVTATDQIGRQVSLVSAGSLASGITGYIAPADTAGIGGTYTEAQVVLDWPESLLSGQRYTISVDATNKIGYSI